MIADSETPLQVLWPILLQRPSRSQVNLYWLLYYPHRPLVANQLSSESLSRFQGQLGQP
jgi:hypothetical protein